MPTEIVPNQEANIHYDDYKIGSGIYIVVKNMICVIYLGNTGIRLIFVSRLAFIIDG